MILKYKIGYLPYMYKEQNYGPLSLFNYKKFHPAILFKMWLSFTVEAKC